LRFFQNRWWIVAASLCGMLVGSGPLHLFVFNIFMKPVSVELGLSRGTLSSAVGLYGLVNAGGALAIGWMLDRWGTRRVMIPALLAFVLVTMLFAAMSSGASVFLIFAVAGVIGGCQTPVPYANVVAKWFDRERGLALGLATAGVGLGVAVLGPIAAVLIGRFGWHGAYFGLAALAFVVGFLPVAIFLRDPPVIARHSSGVDAAAVLPGLTLAEAVRTASYWIIGGAFILAVIAINGTISQLVPYLTDKGIPLAIATSALSASGIAIIVGRAISGWFLDRFWGPYVAASFFTIPIAGILLLAVSPSSTLLVIGAALCGMGIGAEVDMMAFFASRYCGLKAYGRLYGSMFAIFALGVAIGPTLAGLTFDFAHSYVPVFIYDEIALVGVCLLFLRLGPYPYPAAKHGYSGAEAIAAAVTSQAR
jgi:MFS family permease